MRRILLIMIGASLLLYASFSRDSSGVVADSATGLAWQDDYSDNGEEIKEATWQEALFYCEELSLGDRDDWRLPNIKELRSITDKSKYDPAIDSVFTNVTSSYYWSSTTVTYSYHWSFTTGMSGSSKEWTVNFNYGSDGWRSRTNEHYVRCVRGGL